TSTGRFVFQGQGALTSMKRFFTIGESLANIYYLNALRNLFQESLRFVGDRTGSGGVTPQDIRGAWQGLRNICDTYSGEKRFKLLSLVKEITDPLPASCVDEASPRRIREHFRVNVRYSFNQNVYLEKSNPGVCLALCLDWSKRQLTAGKTGY